MLQEAPNISPSAGNYSCSVLDVYAERAGYIDAPRWIYISSTVHLYIYQTVCNTLIMSMTISGIRRLYRASAASSPPMDEQGNKLTHLRYLQGGTEPENCPL